MESPYTVSRGCPVAAAAVSRAGVPAPAAWDSRTPCRTSGTPLFRTVTRWVPGVVPQATVALWLTPDAGMVNNGLWKRSSKTTRNVAPFPSTSNTIAAVREIQNVRLPLAGMVWARLGWETTVVTNSPPAAAVHLLTRTKSVRAKFRTRTLCAEGFSPEASVTGRQHRQPDSVTAGNFDPSTVIPRA